MGDLNVPRAEADAINLDPDPLKAAQFAHE